MAGIKIVDLPSLGRDLLSTDLLEVSIAGTASRKITGQEIMNASKLAVGTTPIVSGTVGRLLFQGTGDVLQQSANLFWDESNGFLGIGTSSPSTRLEVQGGDVRFANALTIGTIGTTGWQFSSNTLKIIQNGFISVDVANNRALNITNAALSTFYFRVAPTTGNILINTSTDAGFRLDVNGTARVSGNFTVVSDIYISRSYALATGAAFPSYSFNGNSGSGMFQAAANIIGFSTANTERMRIFSTGNIGINTTTDAGFLLDVNGTARVSSTTTIGTSAFDNGSNLITLISNAGTCNIRVGGGGAIRFSTSVIAPVLQSTDYVDCVRVLVGGANARLTAPSSNWLSVTDTSQSSNGSGNLSVNAATFGTGYANINNSAQVQIDSTTRGFLPPRMTNAQRTAIVSPAVGLIVYCTDVTEGLWVYKSTGWTFIV